MRCIRIGERPEGIDNEFLGRRAAPRRNRIAIRARASIVARFGYATV